MMVDKPKSTYDMDPVRQAAREILGDLGLSMESVRKIEKDRTVNDAMRLFVEAKDTLTQHGLDAATAVLTQAGIDVDALDKKLPDPVDEPYKFTTVKSALDTLRP